MKASIHIDAFWILNCCFNLSEQLLGVLRFGIARLLSVILCQWYIASIVFMKTGI